MDTVIATEQFERRIEPRITDLAPSRGLLGWVYGAVGTVVILAIGTWFIWFSAQLQRSLAADDVRAACRRVMPETAERCFDTVVIQRGGVRR
jgi:hypothetical protein